MTGSTRGPDDPLPPRAHRSVATIRLDDLAHPQTPGLRHARASQAAQELLHPLRGEPAQRDVAVGRHLHRAGRRPKGRDPVTS